MQDENKTKPQLIKELRQLRAEAATFISNQAEAALPESEQYLKQAQAMAHVGHWKLDPETNEVSGSDELFRIFGLTPDESSLEAFASVVHPDDREYDLIHIQRGIEQGKDWDIEHRLLLKDGTEKHVHAIGHVTKDGDGRVKMLVGTVQDITERKQAEEKMREMAYHDHLTGLPNRALFYDRLEQALAHTHRNRKLSALLALDLDNFKLINDELGHTWGDQALIEVGKRLLKCVRATDTVARLGGDEFNIILVDVASEETVCKIAKKVMATISQPLPLKKSQYTLSASIGIHLISPGDGDMDNIISRADSAMYQAKKECKNCYRISG